MIRTEDYLREIVTIFFAQKKIIWTTVAAFVLFAIAVALVWPPVYSAEGQVLIKGKKVEKSPEALEDTQIRMFELSTEDLSSEMYIMTSHDVVAAAIRTMAEQGVIYGPEDLEPQALVQNTLSLQSRLSTDIATDSNIIDVSLTASDPRTATIELDYLMAQYLIQRGQIHTPTQAADFFARQVGRYNDDLEERENQLIALVARTGAPNPAMEIENNLARKNTLEQQLSELENAVLERRGLVEHLDEELASHEISFFSFVENPAINQLGEKLQQVMLEEGNLLRLYTPRHEEVVAIREQIGSLSDRLRQEVGAYRDNEANLLTIEEERLQAVRDRIAEIGQRNIALHTQLVEQDRINRELELLNHSYNTFAKRLEESRISGSAEADTLFMVSVLSEPFSSGIPVFPNKRTLLPIALFAGIITGCSLGFLKEYFDHTFKKPGDPERYAGLQTLFTIPNWRQ